MLRFLRKTSLYLLALPLLFTFLGIASNQAVLAANSDRFPVMWNNYKVNEYRLHLEKAAADDDPDVALQAQFDLAALREGFIDDTHCIMTKDTHLNFLADYIDFHTATYSPGDELLELGEWSWSFAFPVWIFAAIQKLRKVGDSENGDYARGYTH
jgi:hypothetical protein